MTRFLWLHPWDLEGWEPEEFLDEMAAAGFGELRLALAYHGGRLLLPRNHRHLVYQQHDGAVYFAPTRWRYGDVQPAVGPHTEAVERFLVAAAQRRFPVRAWLVLCHNDWLGPRHPELCIRNYRQEPYTYALCPAQPAVQRYILGLIADAAGLPGITGLDLEALSFMGYDHNSLHDKRAVAVPPELNVCHCSACRGEQDRVAVVADLLDQIRRVTTLPIDLRYTDDPSFYGGKTHLPLSMLAGRVQSITRTWFGTPAGRMVVPPDDPVPANVGFQFHPPDTNSEEEFAERWHRAAGANAVGLYCYGLANQEHWEWLTRVFEG